MTPEKMVAKGRALIKKAILAHSKEHKAGLRQIDFCTDLGLELSGKTFTRVLARELLNELVNEKRIHKKGRLYFPAS